MLLDAIALLILRHLIAKLVFADEVAINEQIDGIVQCGAAHAVPLGGHVCEQCIDVEMAGIGINLSQNGEALRRFSMAVLL